MQSWNMRLHWRTDEPTKTLIDLLAPLSETSRTQIARPYAQAQRKRRPTVWALQGSNWSSICAPGPSGSEFHNPQTNYGPGFKAAISIVKISVILAPERRDHPAIGH